MATSLLTAKEAAEMINTRIVPPSATQLNDRSIARLCKLKRFPNAYMVLGDWCLPSGDIEAFIFEALQNRNGRNYRKRAVEFSK